MTLTLAFFYLFSIVCIASGVMVIAARNPVHSVLFLILAFFNAAGIFMIAGAEFLALILIVVYVGAVAVLFLFVVMMLDIDLGEMRKGVLQYMPIGALIGIILLIELVMVMTGWTVSPEVASSSAVPMPDLDSVSNTKALGMLIYTRYVYQFEAAGLVLLVAMMGAIVLTLHHKPKALRQDIAAQVARNPSTSIEIIKVESGKGL